MGTVIKQLTHWYKRRRLYKQTVTELSKLSPQLLNDVGLHKDNIKSVAAKLTYGEYDNV